LNRLFHGPSAKRLLNAAPKQELESRFGDGQVEAVIAQSVEVLANGKVANFTLSFR
jgi:hypothetical protein